MNGLSTISKVQKTATLREYGDAVRLGNAKLASRIRNANGKWITSAEFKKAEGV